MEALQAAESPGIQAERPGHQCTAIAQRPATKVQEASGISKVWWTSGIPVQCAMRELATLAVNNKALTNLL